MRCDALMVGMGEGAGALGQDRADLEIAGRGIRESGAVRAQDQGPGGGAGMSFDGREAAGGAATRPLNGAGAADGAEGLMVSLRAEVPEALLTAMGAFIERHPSWDQYRLFQAALAGFLVQNGVQDRGVTRCYLANLFPSQRRFAALPQPPARAAAPQPPSRAVA